MRVLIACGVVALLASVALAQGIPASSPVVVSTPDGGLPVTVGAQRVAVEATGLGGSAVEVNLTEATIAAIGPHACTHGGVRRLALGATPEAVPNNLPDGGSGAFPGRTMITLQNVDGNHDVACRFDPGDGGLPDCAVPGYGLTVFPRARYVELPARATDTLLCVACTGVNVPLEYLERSCAE
jgi:hypothetical protein